MDASSNLSLPFIMAAQAQKHVTHNEALRALDAIVQLAVADKDLDAPPGSPDDGACYIVAASPTGAWSGQAGRIAAWQDGAWAFYAAREGWLAWVADEDTLYVWNGAAWAVFAGGGGGGGFADVVDDTTPQLGGDLDANGHAIGFDDGTGLTDDAGNEQIVFHKTASAVNQVGITNAATGSAPQIAAEGSDTDIDLTLAGKGSGHPKAALFGINATADATTKFAVAAEASLFNHAGAGHQHKINKAAAGDTASLLFQTATSGRAEMGTAGDDDFHFKVSADGSTWKEAIVIDRSTGAVAMPLTPKREVLTANRTYYIRADGSDSNTGLADTSGGAFLTIQKAINVIAGTLDIAGFSVTIQVADGTYTGPSTLKNVLGYSSPGCLVIQGNSTTPANVLISTTGATCFTADNTPVAWDIKDLKMQTHYIRRLHQRQRYLGEVRQRQFRHLRRIAHDPVEPGGDHRAIELCGLRRGCRARQQHRHILPRHQLAHRHLLQQPGDFLLRHHQLWCADMGARDDLHERRNRDRNPLQRIEQRCHLHQRRRRRLPAGQRRRLYRHRRPVHLIE
jgi:hypothetical protein